MKPIITCVQGYVCVVTAAAMNDVMCDLKQLAAELLSPDSDSDNADDGHLMT